MRETNDVRSVRVCIDAVDVDRVTDFWVSLFGYERREPVPPDDDWRYLDSPSPALPALSVQPVPEHKTVKNRLHFDIFVADPEPWIRRSLELGATKLRLSAEPGDWFQVLADPEGNEFCICLDDEVGF